MEPVTTTPVTLHERRRMQDSRSVCRSMVPVVSMVIEDCSRLGFGWRKLGWLPRPSWLVTW